MTAGPPEIPVFQRIGEAGIARIVGGFYRRVAQDPVLRPLYPDEDLGPAEGRLSDFLVYRLGGPPRYVQQRGHPRLRMRHAPFAVDQRARDRWMELMAASIAEQGDLPADVAEFLLEFLGGVATFLINR